MTARLEPKRVKGKASCRPIQDELNDNPYVEMSQSVGSSCKPSVREPVKKGRVHVGELWMSYPSFDSSDFLYENRTYQNYILRERPITFEDMERLRILPSGMNAQRLSPSVPEDMLPMVYYVGDGDTMMVAI